MFFTPTLDSKWLFVQKASQYLMILLLVFALFIPLLYMPQESDAAILTAAAIIGGAAIVVTIWIYLDGKCDYCGIGSEDAHFKVCTNCHDGIFNCPMYGNPHTAYCGQCWSLLYTCDAVNGPTAAEIWTPHANQDCDYCSDEYRPCTEGDEHGNGVCNNNDDQGSSGNNSSSSGTG